MFVSRKKPYKFKENNKNVNFPSQFCLGSISNKYQLRKNILYDFTFDYNAIYKYGILNIDKYLMVENNIKKCSGLLSKYLLCY